MSDETGSIGCPEHVRTMLVDYGVSLEDHEFDALGRYLALLMDANTRMNLTAIRDPDEAWSRHLFDALTLIPVLAEVEGVGGARPRVVDIGSGGGLPGLPLAIAMGGVDFTLVDATKKKTDFLERAAEALGLGNVRVVNARAEAVGQDRGVKTGAGREGAHRASYDAALARAVGRVAMVAELTVPLVRVGGLVVLTKGQKADEELGVARKALHMLHASHAGTVETPTGRLVVLEKTRETPKDYPRRDGEPKRSPLGVGS